MIQTQCRTACKWAQIWAWTCTMQTFLNTREHWMKTHTYHPNPPNDTLLLLSILSVWPSQQSLLPLSSGNCVLCWQSSSMGVCIYIYTHTLCILALCLSLSDPGSLSHSLSHPLPLCLPSLLLFFTCLSTAAVVQFATWPVNNFPETSVHSLSNPRSNLTHWEIQVHIFQQGRGGAKWGGATTTGLFPTQTHV